VNEIFFQNQISSLLFALIDNIGSVLLHVSYILLIIYLIESKFIYQNKRCEKYTNFMFSIHFFKNEFQFHRVNLISSN
jgi:hypothetical protein